MGRAAPVQPWADAPVVWPPGVRPPAVRSLAVRSPAGAVREAPSPARFHAGPGLARPAVAPDGTAGPTVAAAVAGDAGRARPAGTDRAAGFHDQPAARAGVGRTVAPDVAAGTAAMAPSARAAHRAVGERLGWKAAAPAVPGPKPAAVADVAVADVAAGFRADRAKPVSTWEAAHRAGPGGTRTPAGGSPGAVATPGAGGSRAGVSPAERASGAPAAGSPARPAGGSRTGRDRPGRAAQGSAVPAPRSGPIASPGHPERAGRCRHLPRSPSVRPCRASRPSAGGVDSPYDRRPRGDTSPG